MATAGIESLMISDGVGQKGAGKDLGNKGYQKPCFICEMPFPTGTITTIEENDYHPKCFKCHKCDKQLITNIENENSYRKVEDKFYCGPCVDSTTLYKQWVKENPDSKLIKDKERSTKHDDMACYLTYVDNDNGTLFVTWSETSIEGALASFVAGVAVPKWKITKNGGKTELKRKCAPMFPKEYATAWTHFIKMVQGLKGQVTLLAPSESHNIAIYLHRGGPFAAMEVGKTVSLEGVDAACAVPRLFDFSCSSMEKSLFIATGNEHNGHGLGL